MVAMPIDFLGPLLTKRSYVARHFAMTLDGYQNVGFLKSVEGGAIKSDIVAQQIGGQAIKVKQIGNPKVEPFSVQVGMGMSPAFYTWIKNSWAGQVERRTGALITMDRNLKVVHEQSFDNALITETAFPALDGSSKDPAYLTVKFQAETSRHKQMTGDKAPGAEYPSAQKMWSPANFRVELDGVDCGRVAKVDAFTIKQGVKLLETGPDRERQLEPVSLEYPNLTLTTSQRFADDFFAWHEDFVIKGNNSAAHEKTGSIILLSPNRTQTLLRINMSGVGIAGVTVDKGDSGSDAIRRVKIELYVEEMGLEYEGASGAA
jgi:hypothetical protein